MRILHCCLSNFYVDNFSYQENILPKMHKLQGHQVAILASTETYIEMSISYVKPSSYFNEHGIPITRLPYSSLLPHLIMKKVRIYKGVKEAIQSFSPEIIFIHDCQFISIRTIASYIKMNPSVIVYIDGHTDYNNSARNWLSKNILHKIIYRWCAKTIEPYAKKFYGVLPVRVDFFKSMYGISSNKLELLPLGVDDSIVDFSKQIVIRSDVRKDLIISESDFVIITGGKIDERKNIHTLMKVIHELEHVNIKLIVFGTPTEPIKDAVNTLSDHKNIRYIGWIKSDQIYNYFMASDLACFPGTHSVLWEQAVGSGIPCVFRKWEGINHVDVGGNCLFLNSGDKDEIKNLLLEIYHDTEMYEKMKTVANTLGITNFLYSEIAKRAIEFH